jgi:hypothetical protein
VSNSAGVFVGLLANGLERWRRKQFLKPRPLDLFGQEVGSSNPPFSAAEQSDRQLVETVTKPPSNRGLLSMRDVNYLTNSLSSS